MNSQKKPRNNRRIKIFGERNTGTRAVAQMLRAHRGVVINVPRPPDASFDMLMAQINSTLKGFRHKLFQDTLIDARLRRLKAISAWKHTAPVVDESFAEHGASVLFMVRDPYSWATSFFRHPYHARAHTPDRLEDFLQQPWLTMQRDNTAPVLTSPLVLWNEKLRAYRAFALAAPVPSTVLKFEDFVLDPVAALGAALVDFGISSTGLAEANTTKKNGLSARKRVRYYKENSWQKEISPEAARLINSYIDWDVATAFGYTMRDPAEF